MKTVNQLVQEFKGMSLCKQSLIAMGTITLIVAFLANYKDIKQGSTQLIKNITNDENIQEFLADVHKAIKSFGNLWKGFVDKGVEE